MWGSRNGAAFKPFGMHTSTVRQACAVSTPKQLQMFRKTIGPSSASSSSPKRAANLLGLLEPAKVGIIVFRKWVTVHQSIWRNIPWDSIFHIVFRQTHHIVDLDKKNFNCVKDNVNCNDYIAVAIDEEMRLEHSWQYTGKRKPVPSPLRPTKITHGLARNWTRASMVRGPRLTAWTIGRP